MLEKVNALKYFSFCPVLRITGGKGNYSIKMLIKQSSNYAWLFSLTFLDFLKLGCT